MPSSTHSQQPYSPEPYSPELRPAKSPFVTDKLNLNNSESVTITDESNKSEKVPLDILFGKKQPINALVNIPDIYNGYNNYINSVGNQSNNSDHSNQYTDNSSYTSPLLSEHQAES